MSILLPKESLHSLILRYHLRHGNYSEIYQSVISHRGYWRSFETLRIPEIYNKLTDSVWYEIIGKVLIPDKYIYRYDRDIIAYNALSPYLNDRIVSRRIFRSGHISFPINRQIKYCQCCFLEDLSFYGVGYFRKDWLNPDYKNCKKHQLLLDTMVLNKGEKAIESILKILTGKSVNNQMVVKSTNEVETDPQCIIRNILKNSTPCLWLETISFIQYFVIKTFKQYEVKLMSSDYKAIHKLVMTPKGQLKYITWSKEVELVKRMSKVFKIELTSFLIKNSKHVVSEVQLPDSTIGAYDNNKYKFSKCDSCLEPTENCLSSKLIDFSSKKFNQYIGLHKSNLLLPHRNYKNRNNVPNSQVCVQTLR
ncbi:TniQ family protein [Psychrosphaera haliotis]|nr:TniQ family protein [Psychrosphaera haliotis]